MMRYNNISGIDFDSIFNNWNKKVYHYALGKTNSKYIAEETVQRVFIKLWKNLSEKDIPASIEAQIFTISKTILLDIVKEETNRRKLLIDDKKEVWSESPLDIFQTKELDCRIQKAIESMPATRKEIFQLSRFEHLSYREIANKLSISPKTVENHIHSALKTLRQIIFRSLFILFYFFFYGYSHFQSYYLCMKLTKEILERYLKGNCSDEEITFIHENIDKIKDQADVLFSEEEWIDADNLSEYPNAEEIRKRIVDHIEDPIRKHRIQKRRKMVTWSVAASVILLISSVFYFFGTDTKHPIEPEIVLHEKPTTDPSTNLYYINSGKDVMHITAADGSSISLYPQSEIKFPEHFHKKISRDFFLKGKAKFHVAKDKNKPFHVHPTGMTTTALGTVFIVDELASS